MDNKQITSRAEDYSQWYLDVIDAAQMAEHSPVKGSMIIKPYGYAIWERIQEVLDGRFKEVGVENAYFPLLIPMNFLSREADHVEGFAKECAVVTHHRLETGKDGKLQPAPAAELEEPFVIRPTSETIIGDSMSRWISSHRDLPMILNQWCNVMRWEMRTRLFLRTSEFLWQEGHTAHATAEEADAFARQMFDVYQDFAENVMAIPAIAGRKTDSERFAGAHTTYCLEAMMQDGKALQFGTSHYLADNFAKAFNIKYSDQNNEVRHCHQTSWGVSTRMIGGLIMTHSDDKGLVVPPRLAPIQAVIIPLMFKEGQEDVVVKAEEVGATLKAAGVRIKVDKKEGRPGEKFFAWEKKGVPVRIELGPRDIAANSCILARRDTGEKITVSLDDVATVLPKLLEEIQASLYSRALAYREERTVSVDSWDDFKTAIEAGKFVHAHWSGDAADEAEIKKETSATIRCIPFDAADETGACVYSGKPSARRVLFAKSY